MWLGSNGAPEIRPVKVASVIDLPANRTKSSANSISNLPDDAGRVAVAIFPSGLPVLKKVVSAAAGSAKRQPSSDSGIANRALSSTWLFSPRNRFWSADAGSVAGMSVV